MELFATGIIILAIAFLFVLTGVPLMTRLLPDRFRNFYFMLGTSFYTGAALFLCSWSLFTSISNNATGSLFTTAAIAIIWVYAQRKQLQLLEQTARKIAIVVLILIAFMGSGVLRALTPMPLDVATNPSSVNPFEGFGSVGHSFRAGNLTEFIVAENTFPRINQHSGQSIVASIPLFAGREASQLSLTLSISIYIAFVAFLVYGFSCAFIQNRLAALIPPLVVLLGNTVLSPVYSSITDTESALLLATNIDSLFGIATFFIAILMLYHCVKDGERRVVPILGAFAFIWNITSGQMILLFCAALALVAFLHRSDAEKRGRVVTIGGVFAACALLGVSMLGGMLHPDVAETQPDIPGIMQVRKDDVPAIGMRFPRTGESGSTLLYDLAHFRDLPEEAAPEPTDESAEQAVKQQIKDNEFLFALAKIVRSVQVVFFPLLGLYLMYLLLRRGMIEDDDQPVLQYLLVLGTYTFVLGWVASTFFTFYGYYWELSKFLYFGSFAAMLLLGLSCTFALQKLNSAKRLLLALVLVCMTIGPITNYFIVGIYRNIYVEVSSATPRTMILSERYEFLLQKQNMFGTTP